jgi:hypothetical protein
VVGRVKVQVVLSRFEVHGVFGDDGGPLIGSSMGPLASTAMAVTSVYRVLIDLVLFVAEAARPLAFAEVARRSLKTTTTHLYVPAVTLSGPLGLEAILLLVLGQTVRGTTLPLLVFLVLVWLDVAHRDMVV